MTLMKKNSALSAPSASHSHQVSGRRLTRMTPIKEKICVISAICVPFSSGFRAQINADDADKRKNLRYQRHLRPILIRFQDAD
jgi:hypothetical protein